MTASAFAAPIFPQKYPRKNWALRPLIYPTRTDCRNELFWKSTRRAFQSNNSFLWWFIDYPGQYEYVAEYYISKFEKLTFLRDFEICQNSSRNSIFCFFVRLLVPPIWKHFLIKLAWWNFACRLLTTFPRAVFFSRETLKKWFFWPIFLVFESLLT